MSIIEQIKRIAKVEFAGIVKYTYFIEYKLRIILINDSFIDVYISQRLSNKFGFHWECIDGAGTFYRYDNFPDKNWQSVATFPHHFHNGSQEAVEASPFSLIPIDGFRDFMKFVKKNLK